MASSASLGVLLGRRNQKKFLRARSPFEYPHGPRYPGRPKAANLGHPELVSFIVLLDRPMNRFTTKIGISNSRSGPLVVVVEPWASYYTLLPGEELLILAFGNAAAPWFNIVEWDDTTQVFCEDTADFKVMQVGKELECGHKQQDGKVMY